MVFFHSLLFFIYWFSLFNPFEKNTCFVLPAYLYGSLLCLVFCRSSSTAVWPPRWLNGSVTSESSSTSRWSGLHGRLSARLSRGWLEFFVFRVGCLSDWFATLETAKPLTIDSSTMHHLIHHMILQLLNQSQHELCFPTHSVKKIKIACCCVCPTQGWWSSTWQRQPAPSGPWLRALPNSQYALQQKQRLSGKMCVLPTVPSSFYLVKDEGLLSIYYFSKLKNL